MQHYYQRTHILLGTLCQLQQAYGEGPAPGSRTAAGGGLGGQSAAASVEINTLNVLPVVPRFQYLPISTPMGKNRVAGGLGAGSAAAAAAAGGGGGGGGGGGVAVGVGVLGGGEGVASGGQGQGGRREQRGAQGADLAAQYSLANLGGSLTGARGVGGGGPGGVGAVGGGAAGGGGGGVDLGGSALSALQARLPAGGFSAFGSMLGDKAAEVSAMAQGFGELLPTGATGIHQALTGSFLSLSRQAPFTGTGKK